MSVNIDVDINVSIIITAHNYAKYLPKAIDSCLGQNFQHGYEVIIVDDGSTDNTKQVLEVYKSIDRVHIIHLDGVGLPGACNVGISKSIGKYIIRLDADDWFDENILLILSNYLDSNKSVGMVFSDYYIVNKHGDIVSNYIYRKINKENHLFNRPALAAGAMYRKHCYDSIQGYNGNLKYQEDYDFWIRFIEKYKVNNISLPLMYYRRHSSNMSNNWNERMSSRRYVKNEFVKNNREKITDGILAVIPARSDKIDGDFIPLLPFMDSTLLGVCIKKLSNIDAIERTITISDNKYICEQAKSYGSYCPCGPESELVNNAVSFEQILSNLLKWLKQNDNYNPKHIIIILPISPFIHQHHIIEAMGTLLLYDTDSVIGVTEDKSYHWRPGDSGLIPVGYKKRYLQQEKDIIYKESGGIYLINTENIIKGSLLGESVGHIDLSHDESLKIRTKNDYLMATKVIVSH